MYQIDWSDTATGQLNLLEGQFSNWTSVRLGLEWGLQRKPWIRDKIPGTSLRVWQMGPLFNVDGEIYSGKFFYEFSEGGVAIEWIELITAEE